MISRLKTTIFFLVFGLFSALPLLSSAQIPTSIDGIQISSSPSIPSPGQTTIIEIESFSTDLQGASIVWLVDGKSFAKGIGKTSITLKAPPLGKTTTVIADIMTAEKREVRKTISLKSGGVDLISESAGFVPPFFEGKAPFAYQNTVRVAAIPHLAGAQGTELSPGTLLYRWTVNDKVVESQSGYGKQVLTVQETIPRPIDVIVEVSTPTGTSKATASLTLTPQDPAILFYEDDPLYGTLYNKALVRTASLANQEISIRAVPFAFSVFKNLPLTFNWSINNLERPDLSTNESIILRTKGDVEGTSSIGLEIRNQNQILQGARNALNISFTKTKTQSGIF